MKLHLGKTAVALAVSIAVLGIAAAPPAPAAAATSNPTSNPPTITWNGRAIRTLAWNQLGLTKSDIAAKYKFSTWAGDWCADFAALAWENSGANLNIPAYKLTGAAASFETYGIDHQTISSSPVVGDAGVFEDSGGTIRHVGIVSAVLWNGSVWTIQTIEGNVGDTDDAHTTVRQAQYYAEPHHAAYTPPVSGGAKDADGNPPVGSLLAGTWQVKEYVAPATRGDTYHPLFVPGRAMDSRYGTGNVVKFQAGVPQTLHLSGTLLGLPTNTDAVTGNITVVGQTAAGYVSVAPVLTYGVTPATSTINFPVKDINSNGHIRANGLTVQVEAGPSGPTLDFMYGPPG